MKRRELLFSLSKKDFIVDTFRSGGKGGQNQNKRDTGVRIRHLESGAVGESREERSQLQNRKSAFRRMVESKKFQLWIRRKAAESQLDLRMIESKVDEEMCVDNLKIETYTP